MSAAGVLLWLWVGLNAERPVEHVGQIVCSKCWFEAADRLGSPYGTAADLVCAARCSAEGIPAALAVRSGDEFRLLLLEDDRDWLPSIGGFAKIRGTTAPRGDDTYIKTTSIVMLDESPWATAAVDDTPVELTWTDLGGQEQSLDSYRGRIVVLNFWATWCAPCRDEMPDLVRIQNHFGIYGVQVVGAAADPPASADTVLEFARRLKLNFPILLGADTAQMQSLGAGVALPATVVLDREGRIVEKIAGVVDRRRLESILERLVTSPQSAAVDPASDLLASGDAHGHGHDHDHPPHDGTQASLVPS